METKESIRQIIKNNLITNNNLLENEEILSSIENIIKEIVKAFSNDKKILLCGNGGSAADAQHIAAEFSGKFYLDRKPLFAESLTVNTSYITAVANDIAYDEIFSRLLLAQGRKGDILIGISTSGNSKNIIKAVETANELEMITIGLIGSNKGSMEDLCKYVIRVPSIDTPRIQESHILIGHIICELVEKKIFQKHDNVR